MNLNQIEAFVTIVQYSSFSKAAEKLFLTQPTVSSSIARLESELGVKLFIRTKQDVEMTESGKQIYLYAKEMVDLAHKIKNTFSGEGADMSHEIIISTSSVPGSYLVPEILAELARLNPALRFRVCETDSAGVIQDIEENNADIGFLGTYKPRKDIEFIPFYQDELVIAAPNTERYILLKEQGDDLDWIRKENWLIREKGSGTRRESEKLMKSWGMNFSEMNIMARFSNTDALLKTVAKGFGITIVSRLAAQTAADQGKILIIPPYPGQGTYRWISMAVSALRPVSEDCKALMQLVSKLYPADENRPEAQ